ncbi:MAG: M28 family peptidase, partial [Candidatus Rokubacteria bacterium]|nr:M28 family peptidase [Candidatus Rokubacteria bacterium]
MNEKRRRDLLYFVRGRINRGVARVMNARHPVPGPAAPLEAVLREADSLLARCALLEGRTNPERETAVARWLEARGVPYATHAFTSFEGTGRNFSVDVGAGDRVLVLIAHHDAVPGSPGANDNAAAVAILLTLLERLGDRVPRGLRVRLLFTAGEEVGYLGARAYVKDVPLAGIAGVISLEL